MKSPTSKEALIVKFAALGDVLRTASLITPLAAAGYRTTFLTSPEALPLLKGHPRLFRGIGLRLSDPGARSRLARRLKKRFDRVLSMEEQAAAAEIARTACRGEVIGVTDGGRGLGYTASSAPYYDMSLLNRDPDGGHQSADRAKKANRRSYTRLWLDILALESSGAAAPSLFLSDADFAPARKMETRFLSGPRGPLIGLCPDAGSRWPAKRISTERAVGLLAALGRATAAPLLLLSGREAEERKRGRDIAARFSRIAGMPPLIIAPPYALRRFAALLGLCDVVVTADSLALHIARALGRPAVALVGPTSAAELDFAPGGSALLPPTDCACYYQARCSRARRCIDDIGDRQVLTAVRRCLDARKRGAGGPS